MDRRVIQLIFLVLSLSLLATTVAAEESYSLMAPGQNIFVSECDIFQETLTLTNTGTQAIKPSVSVVSEPTAEWTTIVPKSMLLAPGERQTIDVFLKAPCNLEGAYDLKIRVDNVQQPKELHQLLTIQSADNIFFSIEASRISTCPCTGITVPFTLKNKGNFFERYEIYTETNEDVYSIVPANVGVLPGDTVSGFLNFRTPCDAYGDFSAPLTVRSVNANSRAQVQMDVTVNQCYDFSLTAPSYIRACQDAVTYVPINISNTADIANAYTMELDDEPRWTRLLGNQIALDPHSSGYTELELFPAHVEPGNYSLLLSAETEIGTLEAERSIQVEVPICYGVELGLPTSVDLCEETIAVPFNVTNTGEVAQPINITIDAEEFMSLSDGQLEIGAGETASVDLLLDGTNISKETYMGRITATYAYNHLITTSLDVSIQAYTNEECYRVTFAPTRFLVNATSEESHGINISHVGIKGANYTLGLNGTDFAELETDNVALEPGQSTVAVITTAPEDNITEGSYWAVFSASTHGVQYAGDIRFNVGEPSNLFLYVAIAIAIVLAILLIVLVILLASRTKEKKRPVGRPPKKKTAKKEGAWIKWLILGIIVAIIVLAAIWIGYVAMGPTVNISNMTNTTTVPVDTGAGKNMTNATDCGIFCQIGSWWQGLFNGTNTTVVNQTAPMDNATIPSEGNETAVNETCGVFCHIGNWFESLFVPMNQTAVNETEMNETLLEEINITDNETGNETGQKESIGGLVTGIYIAAGIIIALLIIAIIVMLTNMPRHAKEEPATAKKAPIKDEPKKKEVTKKAAGKKAPAAKEGVDWLKWVLLIIVALIILFGIVFVFTLTNSADVGNETMNQTAADNVTNATTCGIFCGISNWWQNFFNGTNTTAMNATEGNITIPEDNETTSNETLSKRELAIQRINDVLREANETGQLDTFSYQVWDEDTEHTINLSRYFVDPDEEAINYTAFPVEDIAITIEDGIATLVPSDDFIGVRYTSFIAEDSSGSEVKSPVVTLVVVPKESFFEKNINAILTAVIILLLILIVLFYDIFIRQGTSSKKKATKKRQSKKSR
jgi:uncharacterized membrane protein